ncbi:MAG: response regulator [Methylobacterium sp.]|uniref:response regulator transcription factor n=1 Tax=Methylobacterium sp. TaxID=409 RepID=UPI0025839F16|nr:response regulator [Methylobacterium sp.]MBY0296990.1 response regulator [Methylobacterium sp.]
MSVNQTIIYVVDDDPAVLHSTRFLLESEGYRVEGFASGHDLLAAFPGPSPGCIILDHVMPDLDGLEVFRRLREVDRHAPVVLITGHPSPTIRMRAREAGVPVIEKPLALEILLGLLSAGGAPPGGGGAAVTARCRRAARHGSSRARRLARNGPRRSVTEHGARFPRSG